MALLWNIGLYFLIFSVILDVCTVRGQGTDVGGGDGVKDVNDVDDDAAEIEDSALNANGAGTQTPEASMTYSWPPETTTTTEFDPCFKDPFLVAFCDVPEDMIDLTFWDMYSIMFSNYILDALVEKCTTGTWCLKGPFDYWGGQIVARADMVMKSKVAASMCQPDMIACFDTITEFYSECSVYPQMAFTTEAIDLVCHLRQNPDLSQQCTNQTLVSLHVTVADVLRRNRMPSEPVENEDTCESAEVHMTKRLICMENSCPGEGGAFREFPPWLWFTEVVGDLVNQCGLDTTQCIDVLQVGETSTSSPVTSSVTSLSNSSYSSAFSSSSRGSQNTGYTSSISTTASSLNVSNATDIKEHDAKPLAEQLYTEELGLMVGGSIAVAVIGILMTFLACTLYRRYRRNAVVKEGYQKLLNDGDES